MVSPSEEEEKPVETPQAPSETAESPLEPPPQPPAKRKGSPAVGLLSALLLLAIVAGAGGYAAIAFKDSDPRLKLVADAIEPYFAQGEASVAGLKDKISALLGETKQPAKSVEAARETKAPVSEPKRAEIAPETPRAPAPAIEAEKQVRALEARLDAVEESAQKALAAAEGAEAGARSAQAAAESAQTTAKTAAETAAEAVANAARSGEGPKPAEEGAFSTKDLLAALEGRIDELGDEIKALRERLDSPKNETRAAPETSAAAPPPAPAPDSFAAIAVVATKLQHELEMGRPFVHEMAALEKLGADPTALAALAPFAEKGAPTAAHLRAEFAPAAKKIRALESEPPPSDLSERLLKGASKLVRVHPSGQAPAQTTDEKVAKIDADLAHGDLLAAQAAFVALSEAAQSEAKEFGEALQARVAAARAVEDLLHGAVAGLGGAKK